MKQLGSGDHFPDKLCSGRRETHQIHRRSGTTFYGYKTILIEFHLSQTLLIWQNLTSCQVIVLFEEKIEVIVMMIMISYLRMRVKLANYIIWLIIFFITANPKSIINIFKTVVLNRIPKIKNYTTNKKYLLTRCELWNLCDFENKHFQNIAQNV